jgi:hypothetical protein
MKDREWLAMGCRMARERGVSLAWPVKTVSGVWPAL